MASNFKIAEATKEVGVYGLRSGKWKSLDSNL